MLHKVEEPGNKLIKMMFFVVVIYTLPTSILFCFHQSGLAITPMIAKAGDKSETEIIKISTNFRLVSCDNYEGI